MKNCHNIKRGQVFKNYTVIGDHQEFRDGFYGFKCKCLCGGTAFKSGKDLISKKSHSCRCVGKVTENIIPNNPQAIEPSYESRPIYVNPGIKFYDIANIKPQIKDRCVFIRKFADCYGDDERFVTGHYIYKYDVDKFGFVPYSSLERILKDINSGAAFIEEIEVSKWILFSELYDCVFSEECISSLERILSPDNDGK